jgi:hypothetical protein
VGRAAFKKGSTPRVVAMPSHSPHASHPSTFRAPGWGAPALPSSCCWRSATLRRWAPFSHRSASRIFIRQPGCIPSPMVTQDGDHQFDGGEKQAGLRPLPALSFKDLHRPYWGGRRAEPELYLPYGPAGHLFLQHSGERALTGLAEGADFDNAEPVGRKRRQLQHAGLAGSVGPGAASGATSHRWGGVWLSARRMGGCCAVRTGGPSKMLHAARAAFVFLDCLVLTPARRLRAEVGVCPSART